MPARIARTGYTGEDGFEIYIAPEAAPSASGTRSSTRARSSASSPAASARATRCAWRPRWRSTATRSTPRSRRWKPDLGWIVKLDKGDFIGRERARRNRSSEGVTRKLIGFEMRGRGIAPRRLRSAAGRRAGGLGDQRRAVAHAEQEHRTVLSSGGASRSRADASRSLIRNQPVDAVTVPTPFYKRAK